MGERNESPFADLNDQEGKIEPTGPLRSQSPASQRYGGNRKAGNQISISQLLVGAKYLEL